QAKAFRGFFIAVQERKRLRLMGSRVARRMLNSTLARAFYTWLNEVEQHKLDTQMSTKEELAIKVRDQQEENERLRRDNERFVRLIDSGEWGRGRVSELVSAGEILKGERDALLKLIQVRGGAGKPVDTPEVCGFEGGRLDTCVWVWVSELVSAGEILRTSGTCCSSSYRFGAGVRSGAGFSSYRQSAGNILKSERDALLKLTQ
ncbi:hypothetical protein DUNSADRAFT_6226, partial [Dunaliella salina]